MEGSVEGGERSVEGGELVLVERSVGGGERSVGGAERSVGGGERSVEGGERLQTPIGIFQFRPLIKSSRFKIYKMYCQQIFPFVQLPHCFLLLALEALSF